MNTSASTNVGPATPWWHRLTYAVIAAVALTFGYMVLDDLTDRVTVAEQRQTEAENASDENAAALEVYAAAVDSLADQVERRGGTPVVDPDALPEPTAIPGPEGPAGPTGPAGPAGRDGTDGQDGQDGLDGLDGQDGADGVDGTGEPGPPGPAGPPGRDGVDGQDGADGADGNDGTATPGTYTCADGQYLAGFTVGVDGSVTLDCRDPGLVLP